MPVEVEVQLDVSTGRLTIGPRLDGTTLYHYTSVGSFMSIIESGVFHMTASRFLNDPTEGTWLRRMLSVVLAQSMADHEVAEEPVWWTAREDGDVYIASFSIDGDQLDQWRAYGADGKGVALGLGWGALPVSLSTARDYDPTVAEFMEQLPEEAQSDFLEVVQRQNALLFERYKTDNPEAPRCDLPISVLPVVYAGPGAFDDAMAVQFRKVFTEPGNDIEFQMQNILRTLDSLVKSTDYSSEREVRAVHTAITGNAFQRRYRESQGRIIPFIEMPWEVSRVAEIVIGPDCKVDERELHQFLVDNGAGTVKIRRSVVPYKKN